MFGDPGKQRDAVIIYFASPETEKNSSPHFSVVSLTSDIKYWFHNSASAPVHDPALAIQTTKMASFFLIVLKLHKNVLTLCCPDYEFTIQVVIGFLWERLDLVCVCQI